MIQCVCLCACVCVCVCMHTQLCLTFCDPMDCSLQAPLSMGYSRQGYWNVLPFPTSGNFPKPGIKPASLVPPAWAGGFFTTSTTWETQSVAQGLFTYRKQALHGICGIRLTLGNLTYHLLRKKKSKGQMMEKSLVTSRWFIHTLLLIFPVITTEQSISCRLMLAMDRDAVIWQSS